MHWFICSFPINRFPSLSGIVAIVLLLALMCRFAWAQSAAPSPATIADQLSTEERVRKPGWWPTKGTFSRDQFIGSAAFETCHRSLVNSQRKSAMARTSTLAGQSEILTQHPLSYHVGPFAYQATVHMGIS